MKLLGWALSIIGGIVTYSNATEYYSKSNEIQAWYHYRAELESAQTYMWLGVVMLVVGIAILLYLKKNNNNGK